MNSQVVIKRNPKRGSYRTGQTITHRLTQQVKDLITRDRSLFRFVEDYFIISRETVYRWLRTNDPALTQIGFLNELRIRIEAAVGEGRIGDLIEKV